MLNCDQKEYQRVFGWGALGGLLGGVTGLLLGLVVFYYPELSMGLAPVSMASPVVMAVAGTWLGIVAGSLGGALLALLVSGIKARCGRCRSSRSHTPAW